MTKLYYSLLALFAGSASQDLARQILFVMQERDLYRSRLPKRLALTAQERRRLLKHGKGLGSEIRRLITIVHPDTFLRWIREERNPGKRPKRANRGRPRTSAQIRGLVIKFARETGWGVTRILGELKKLRVSSVSRTTIRNILAEHGLDTAPKRGKGTWDQFIKRNAATIWQCDFFSKRAVTSTGIRSLFALVFLHVQSRRVYITPGTLHPNEAWVKQQAEAFMAEAGKMGWKATHLIHDRDTKITTSFDNALKHGGINPLKSAPQSPNTNAFVERFIGSLRGECLDHFIVFGERHFNFLVSEFKAHYHEERPHQGADIGNMPLSVKTTQASCREESSEAENNVICLASVRCKQRLGGLLKHYYRTAV